QKAFNYIINWNNTNGTHPSELGLMVVQGMVKDPRCFYCPAEIIDPQFTYQPNPSGLAPQNSAYVYSRNPWPFSTVIGAGGHTRLGFSCRPAVNWPAAGPRGTGTGPLNASNELFYLPNDGKGHMNMPKFSQMKGLALLADTNYQKSKILQR